MKNYGFEAIIERGGIINFPMFKDKEDLPVSVEFKVLVIGDDPEVPGRLNVALEPVDCKLLGTVEANGFYRTIDDMRIMFYREDVDHIRVIFCP